jgi:hypothetical protein
LTLWWLLRIQGIDSDIRIGVRKGTRLEAHAWVEINSTVVNDRSDIGCDFVPFTGSMVQNSRFG